ncbi:DUF7504 family protein [Halorussus ruber]|uniref:DUF7504 family protein n=1 Tax=Halorussus ruber TaxID=1126238 RepID=UPI001091A4AA|nr:hypothetical protein [Halorussus ruber]
MSVRNADGLSFRGGLAPETEEFDVDEMRAKLSKLKQSGSTLLVTGAVGEQTAAYATSNLFGDPEATPPRKRVLALTDGSRAQAAAHFQEADPQAASRNWIIDLDGHERSVPASAAPKIATASQDTDAVKGLRSELQHAIEWFGDGDLKPAQLRVGINSISHLLEKHSFSEVERLIATISASVKVDNGMFHIIYQRDPDENRETVKKLMAHCDAEIQLRKRNGSPAEQRWRIPKVGSTPWTQL